MNRPWLIRCASGREFVVYAATERTARRRWHRRPNFLAFEETVSLELHTTDDAVAVLDNRTALGA